METSFTKQRHPDNDLSCLCFAVEMWKCGNKNKSTSET